MNLASLGAEMAAPTPPLIGVVDDDRSAREALADLLESAGWGVKTFVSAQAFLDSLTRGRPDCVILDLRMPGMNGLDLQEKLAVMDPDLPVIFVSGHGDIPASVRAIKRGAIEFLTKPYRPDDLLTSVQQAVSRGRSNRKRRADLLKIQARFAMLTTREMEVMTRVVAGRLNKQIAAELGVSEITVKVYRRQLMQKLGVESLADLVRAAETFKQGRELDGHGETGERPTALPDSSDDYTKV